MTNKNLLIIDDEELLVQNMKFLLSPFVSKTFTALNGKEGLRVLETEDIHCVICDITMPVMNGVELIKEIRARGSQVPFIFYSAYGNHEMMMEVAKYGAFDFLRKPNFQGLEEVVIRGLNEGFKRTHNTEDNNHHLMSEYQTLLEKLDKN